MENMKEVNNELLGLINEWRNQNNSESFRKVVEQIKNASFYCPIKEEQDGSKMIAITKNTKGDSLLLAFNVGGLSLQEEQNQTLTEEEKSNSWIITVPLLLEWIITLGFYINLKRMK